MVKTTFEMDGLLTEEDIKNRHTVVLQCRNCKKWTIQKNEHEEVVLKNIPCSSCGALNYDRTSIKSLRTYNPLVDNKRRPK